MAIGMLTILSILASTFLIISNLDAEETESLSVRACAEPAADGLLAKAMAQIGADRAVTDETSGPYANLPPGPEGWVRYIDCGHGAYWDEVKGEFQEPEAADPWLASSYIVGDMTATGIGGHLTNIDANENNAGDYNFPVIQFSEGGTYTDGQSEGNKHVDTDGDKVPDAVLQDTGVSSPLTDANNYWAAIRIVDLSSRICVNTGGGWYAGDGPYDRPNGSGPAMIDLRAFFASRGGDVPLYDLFHQGNGGAIKGRIGNHNDTTGGTDDDHLASGSLKGYDRYCGRYLLGPARPGYQPYGIGDEAFFLSACSYKDNISTFGGRLNDMLAPVSIQAIALPDQMRRQLTTMSSVSAVVRQPEPLAGFTELLPVDSVQNAADFQLVYNRMRLMLAKTGIGNSQTDQDRMAAHFAANLWAYCANVVLGNRFGLGVGEPWKFQPAGANFAAFGLRQDMVITQVFARHIPNTQYDANDLTKDDSAWGYAVEIANPTLNVLVPGDYELEIKTEDGETTRINLAGGIPPVFLGASVSATTAPKHVYYDCGFGATRADNAPASLFGETVSSRLWIKKSGLDFRKGSPAMKITLYRVLVGERMPVDSVTVADTTGDLKYDTGIKPLDLTGDAETAPTATETCIHIRRDDRMKNGVTHLARFNMAAYAEASNATNTLLGKSNNVADGGLTVCTYTTIDNVDEYSPGIYRPRDASLVAPTARESMPTDDYFLPSLADLCNIYLTGPIRDFTTNTDEAFTTGILQTTRSKVFLDRPDRGRMPTANPVPPTTNNLADMVDSAPSGIYPDVPPGYLFHEFFTRTPSHQARVNEKKRVYGLVNINTMGLPKNANVNSAAWWLPWPTESPSGSLAGNTGNRLSLGRNGRAYNRATAISYIKQYRDMIDDCKDREGWTEIPGLRSTAGSDVAGFLTPGEVAIPLAKYMDTILGGDPTKDADYVRARNCLFGYISDCLSTRSDVYACYITVQHGSAPQGRRWRYVAVIDRSNVIKPTDKPALLMLTPIR